MRNFLIIVALFFSGCASKQIVYNPGEIASEDLVKVVTKHKGFMQGNPFKSEYNTWIRSVHNNKGEEVTGINPVWDGLLGEVTLAPGEYVFGITCTNGQREGYPMAKFDLKAGNDYRLYCDISKEKGFLGIKVDSSAIVKIEKIETGL